MRSLTHSNMITAVYVSELHHLDKVIACQVFDSETLPKTTLKCRQFQP